MDRISEIVQSVTQAKRVFVTTHAKPDGDAVGSCLGLCRILRGLGREVHILALGPIPRRYQGFVGPDENADPGDMEPHSRDVLIVLDCGDIERAPEFAQRWLGALTIVNVDHHHSNSQFGDLNWVDAGASSVGEMVTRLARQAGWPIDAAAAEALWIAIATDTGRFAYSNTTPMALQCAAELVAKGVSTTEIDHRLYHSFSLDELRVRGRALDSLEVHAEGAIALVSLSLVDFSALGVGPESTEDVVNIPRSLAGARIAGFLYERRAEDGEVTTKLSLRTVEPYDAAAFCRQWGGGGHQRAAGCTLSMPLAEAKSLIIAALRSQWFPSAT